MGEHRSDAVLRRYAREPDAIGPVGYRRSTRLPRWVLGTIVVFLALCVMGTNLGYFVVLPGIRHAVEKSQTAVSNAMAEAVSSSILVNIEEIGRRPGQLVITAADLNVNNDDVPGESGIETGPSGTRIWGVVTEIGPTGITLTVGDGVTYSAVPVLEGGRIAFTEAEVSTALMRLLLSKEGFARGMELGINGALDTLGLTPTAIRLDDGILVITTVPRA
jgi:hypothetical protein